MRRRAPTDNDDAHAVDIFGSAPQGSTAHSAFAAAFRPPVLVTVLSGLLFGLVIGVAPLMQHRQRTALQCPLHALPADCGAAVFFDGSAACTWAAATTTTTTTTEGPRGRCAYAVDCASFHSDAAACAREPVHCSWRAQPLHLMARADAAGGARGRCEATEGWTPRQSGLFASAMVVGAIVGSVAAAASTAATRRRDAAVSAAFVALGSLHTAVQWGSGQAEFSLLLALRGVAGIGVGAACVVSPSLLSERVPAALFASLGALFQVAITLGIAAAAGAGVVFEEGGRSIPVVLGLTAAAGCVTMAMAWAMAAVPPSSPLSPPSGAADATSAALTSAGEPAAAASGSSGGGRAGAGVLASLRALPVRETCAAVLLAVVTQLTGINGIMNYAPNIAASAGFSPLGGNFVVMLWNFVTTLASVPLARRFSPRAMFLGGTFAASVACFVTAAAFRAAHGAITSSGSAAASGGTAASSPLVAFGVAFFIAVFELCIGPFFFVLASELFPPATRSAGTSFANAVTFLCNLAVNFGFPVVVEALGGGQRGLSGVFTCFAVVGAITGVLLTKILPPRSESRKS